MNVEEYFNIKHSKVRNVIEWSFGLLKGRCVILRSLSFFTIWSHGCIVIACTILQNLIERYKPLDYEIDEDYEEEEEDELNLIEVPWHKLYLTIGELNLIGDHGLFFPSF